MTELSEESIKNLTKKELRTELTQIVEQKRKEEKKFC